MNMSGPEIAFDVSNKNNRTEPTFEYIEQRPIKITKKSPYKKMRDLKGFHLGQRFWLAIGTVIVAGGITVMKVNASEIRTPSAPIPVIMETPLIVDDKNVNVTNKMIFDTDESIITIDRENTNTIDFSYEQRKGEIPTRKYQVDKQFENKLTDELIELYEKNGHDYGFDPYLFAGLCMNESSLNPNVSSNPHATGICQVENTNIGSTVSAYNYTTGEVDEIKITVDNLNNLETNIQIGAMIFRNRLDRYNDLYTAIQSYNYGSSSMDMLIRNCEKINPTYEDLYPLIEDLHDNPHKWLSNWDYETYGSKEYVPNVLRYIPGNYTYVNTNQSTIKVYNIDQNELLGEYRIISTNLENSVLENIETNECLNVKNIDIPNNVKKDHAK